MHLVGVGIRFGRGLLLVAQEGPKQGFENGFGDPVFFLLGLREWFWGWFWGPQNKKNRAHGPKTLSQTPMDTPKPLRLPGSCFCWIKALG